MNIEKYQGTDIYDSCQPPEKLRDDFRQFLNMMEYSKPRTRGAINTYNLLCGVEALLCRYETVSKETMLAVDIIEDYHQCTEYLRRLHNNALHQKIQNPKKIEDDV